jgi:hypothetical protein
MRTVLSLAIVSSWALSVAAQDVIYSESRNGTYSRYEQYGYGPNAYVRYRGYATTPIGVPSYYASPYSLLTPGYGAYGMIPTGVTRSYEEHERYGSAPAYGSFYGGLIGRTGPSPGALFESLGPGTRGAGVSRFDARDFGTGVSLPLRETRYVYPDPRAQTDTGVNRAAFAPTPARAQATAVAPAAPAVPRRQPPPAPRPFAPAPAPAADPNQAPGAAPPPPGPMPPN